jgi:hypothetical protein
VVPLRHFFTKECDGVTRLVYMYQRWYAPETGTFMSSTPMPIQIEARYAISSGTHSFGSPTASIDPRGEIFGSIGKIIGSIGKGAIGEALVAVPTIRFAAVIFWRDPERAKRGWMVCAPGIWGGGLAAPPVHLLAPPAPRAARPVAAYPGGAGNRQHSQQPATGGIPSRLLHR